MNDIFTILPDTIYEFILIGGYQVTGHVVITCPNGMVLDDGTHIVQEHIIMFKVVKNSGQAQMQ